MGNFYPFSTKMVQNFQNAGQFCKILGQDTPKIFGKLLLRHWLSNFFSLVTNRPLNGQYLPFFFKLKWPKMTQGMDGLGNFRTQHSNFLVTPFLEPPPPPLKGVQNWLRIRVGGPLTIDHFSLKKVQKWPF